MSNEAEKMSIFLKETGERTIPVLSQLLQRKTKINFLTRKQQTTLAQGQFSHCSGAF